MITNDRDSDSQFTYLPSGLEMNELLESANQILTTNMKRSKNTYYRLLLITASASLLGIAGCSNGSSGGEPAQAGQEGTGLPAVFVSSNWSRPGPPYLYDEIATPAGGGPGLGGSSPGGHSGGSSSGGHSGGSSSGGSSSSSGGGSGSSGGGK